MKQPPFLYHRVALAGLALISLAALVGGQHCQAQSGTRGGYIIPAQPQALPAILVVRLPATAILEIEGSKTQQSGENRRFSSPPLPLGRQYRYTLKATWNDNGQPVVRQRVVPVSGGQEVIVDFHQEPKNAADKKEG